MEMRTVGIIIGIIALVAIAGTAFLYIYLSQPANTSIANPASVNCIEKGGTLEMRETTEGTVGFCIFNDGSECEEWALMRKECKMGDVLCRGQCGDGVCQSNVCMGSGCPCAESSANCALDCGMMVGNDSDANGCKASAGYSWCEVKQKCLRVWEENCTSALEDEALVFCGKPAVASVYTCGGYIQSVSSLPGAGTTFYLNGSIIARCPVVAPDMVSEQCKQLTLGNNCVQKKVC